MGRSLIGLDGHMCHPPPLIGSLQLLPTGSTAREKSFMSATDILETHITFTDGFDQSYFRLLLLSDYLSLKVVVLPKINPKNMRKS